MSNVLMGLGLHYFYVPTPDTETPTFESFQQDSNFNWVSQGRLSRDPAAQFTGPGEDVLIIEGRLFPQHFGGIKTLKEMRESGRAGVLLPLMRFYPADSLWQYAGDYIGNFVIKRIRSTDSLVGVTGIPHKVDFSLELQRYGDDAMMEGDFSFRPPPEPDF